MRKRQRLNEGGVNPISASAVVSSPVLIDLGEQKSQAVKNQERLGAQYFDEFLTILNSEDPAVHIYLSYSECPLKYFIQHGLPGKFTYFLGTVKMLKWNTVSNYLSGFKTKYYETLMAKECLRSDLSDWNAQFEFRVKSVRRKTKTFMLNQSVESGEQFCDRAPHMTALDLQVRLCT